MFSILLSRPDLFLLSRTTVSCFLFPVSCFIFPLFFILATPPPTPLSTPSTSRICFYFPISPLPFPNSLISFNVILSDSGRDHGGIRLRTASGTRHTTHTHTTAASSTNTNQTASTTQQQPRKSARQTAAATITLAPSAYPETEDSMALRRTRDYSSQHLQRDEYCSAATRLSAPSPPS